MVVKGAILARVSDESASRSKNGHSQGSSQSKSISEQVREARAAAQRLGWHVPENREFVDDGLSASSFATKERPGWLELRRFIEAGLVNGVIIWAVNRASREVEDWSGFLNLCKKRRVLIYVIVHDRTYEPARAHDFKELLNEGIDGWYDSEKKSIDVRRGVNGAKSAGRPLSGLAIGYRKVYEGPRLVNLEIEPDGAAKIRQVFGLLDSGEPVTAVARAVGFTPQQVRASARRLTYIAKRRLEDGTLVDCIWEPVVGEDQFWRVQALLDSHRFAGQRWGAHKYLLSYIATCGRCGELITSGRQRGETIYRCAPGGHVVVPVWKADEAVFWELAAALVQPGVLERYLPREDGTEAVRAEAEAARLKTELEEWLNAGVSAAAYKRKEDELAPKIAAAQERMHKALSASPAALALDQFRRVLNPLTGDETEVATADRIKTAMETLDGLPLLAARGLLRETVTVEIYPKKLANSISGMTNGQYLVKWREPS